MHDKKTAKSERARRTRPTLRERLVRGRHPSSMVDSPGSVARLALKRVQNSVDFGRRIIDSLRDTEERGTVVYVMRSRSVIDYAYFNLAFNEHGLKPVRYANGIRSAVIRPVGQALRSALQGSRGLPDDCDVAESLVAHDEPIMLFLRKPRGREIEQVTYALPQLQRMVELQRRHDRDIFMQPLLLIWEKRPDRARPTMLDDFLGTSQSPTFLKKGWYVAQNFWQSFLHLGRPSVQLSSSINLREFIGARSELSDLKIAQELRSVLSDSIQREERVVVGPWVKSAAQMRREILGDPRTRTALQESDIDLSDPSVARNAQDSLREIAADFSSLVIKLWSSVMYPVWNQIYDGIEVDTEGLARVRETARDKRIVIVPSHKSHVDYLVISYIFYQNGLIPPHIAAGVNLSFWPLGPVFRKSGAFFIRRSFDGDALYAKLFHAYLVKLLEEGFAVEFFIEGTRSRTGKLNPPKYGMLNMLVDAFREGNVDDLAFIPVSVGYEKIIEGSSYREELEGGEKKQESIGGLLKTPQILQSQYGRVYVEFGEPIDLQNFLGSYHNDPANIDKGALARSVRRLAYRIIHGINDVTTVSPSAVTGLLILNSVGKGLDDATLRRQAGFALEYLREREARFSGTLQTAMKAMVARLSSSIGDMSGFDEFDRAFLEHADSAEATQHPHRVLGDAAEPSLKEAIQLLASNRIVNVEKLDDSMIYSVDDNRRVELAFYMNNILHYFVDDAVFATAASAAIRNNGGEPVHLDDVREHAQFLSRMLKFDFCFADRRDFPTVFNGAKDTFLRYGWLETDGPEKIAFSNGQASPGFEFIRGLLLPTIESYFLTLTGIAAFDEFRDEKSVTKAIVEEGKRRFVSGELRFPEARAQSTLSNALKLFREWNVVEAQRREKGRKKVREVRLNPTLSSGSYDVLRTRLQQYLLAQERAANDALSLGDACPFTSDVEAAQ